MSGEREVAVLAQHLAAQAALGRTLADQQRRGAEALGRRLQLAAGLRQGGEAVEARAGADAAQQQAAPRLAGGRRAAQHWVADAQEVEIGRRSRGGPTGDDHAGRTRVADRTPATQFGRALGALQAEPADAQIYRRAAPSVVLIVTEGGVGSGTLITADGQILTNHHVIEGAKQVGVIFKPALEGATIGKADLRRAEVLKVDQVADLALIKVEAVPAGVTPLKLGDSNALQVGEGLSYAVSVEDVKTFLARSRDRVATPAAATPCEWKTMRTEAWTDPKGTAELVDTDCDGEIDATVFTPAKRRDPQVILTSERPESKGEIDAMYFDANRDGHLDWAVFDTDADGKFDCAATTGRARTSPTAGRRSPADPDGGIPP